MIYDFFSEKRKSLEVDLVKEIVTEVGHHTKNIKETDQTAVIGNATEIDQTAVIGNAREIDQTVLTGSTEEGQDQEVETELKIEKTEK